MKGCRFLVMTLVVMAMCVFAGCSSDDEDDTLNLKGTIWTYAKTEDGLTTTQKLKFSSEVDCILTIAYTNQEYSESTTIRYTYDYEAPYVNLYPEESGKAVLRGFINGNIMELTNRSNSSNIGTFHKD
ncbi:hypothetical protein [Bacteroides sp.]